LNIVTLRQSLAYNELEFLFIQTYLDAKNAFERADYCLAVILSIDDRRTYNKRVQRYILHNYIREIKVSKSEGYQMEDKFIKL
jgi:hypothetical protein